MNSFSSPNALSAIFKYKRLVLTGVFLFFLGIFWILGFSQSHEAEAFACTAVAGTVNWDSPSSWTGCNSSYPGSPGNGNADTVTIPDSAVVMTANTSVTVASISFTGGTSAASITISNGVTLTVSGSVTINAPTASVTKQLAVTSGILISNGLSIVGGSSTGRNAILSATTGTITTTGGITFSGTAAQAQLTTTGAATVNLTGTISSGGTASIDSTTTLVSTGTSVLNLASTWGVLTVPSGSLTLGGVNITFAGTTNISGTLTTSSSTGTVTFNSSVTVNSGGTLSFSGFSKVTSWGGDIVMNGTTFNSGSGTATLAAGTYALSGSSNISFGAAVTVTGTVINNNSGIVTVAGSFTGAGSWTQGSGSSLKLAGATTNANAVTTFDATSNSNTVEYNHSSSQTLKAVNYHNLVLSNAGAKTMTGVSAINGTFTTSGTVTATTAFTTLAGDMTIGGTSIITMGAAVSVPNLIISGGTLQTGAFDFTVAGTTTISSGTLTLSSNTGTKTLSGQVTLNGGTLQGSSSGIVIVTGITNNSGTVSITGTVTITTAGVIFSGSNTISVTNIVVNSPGTVINNGSVTVGTLLSGTGSWTQGTNSTLTPGGNSNSPVTITTLDASSNVNTVNYNGYNVSCKLVQYYHLSFTNTLNMTCDLTEIILGNFTLGGGVIWSNSSTTIEVNGNFTASTCSQCFTQQPFIVHGTSQINVDFSLFNNSTQTYYGDVTFTGGGLRSNYSTSTVTFGANVINNGGVSYGLSLPGTTIFTSPTASISGTGPTRIDNIQVNGSAVLTNNTTINSYGSSSVNGTGTFVMGTNSVINFYSASAPTVTTFDASSNVNTVNYASSSQTARAITYYHLTLSGSGSTNLTGITTLNGNFTVSGSGNTSAPFTTVGGNIVTSGTVNVTLTASLVVGGSINIGTGTTLVAPGGTLTVGNDFTRVGTFTNNSGTVIFNNTGETSVITGNPAFNNFTVTTAGKNIQVTSGDTLTVLGALTITGSNGNNVILTSTSGSSTFNMTFQSTTNDVTYLTVSWSACVSSYDIEVYDGTSTNGNNNGSCWLFAAPGSATISGTATGNNAATVKVSVNGLVSGSTGTISSNIWSITNVVIPTGAIVVVWVDNVSDANESTAVAKYDGNGNIDGMTLNTGIFTIGSDDNGNIAVSDFAVFDSDNDEDILYGATTNRLVGYSSDLYTPTVIASGNTLTVGSGGVNETLVARDLTVNGTLVTTSTGMVMVNGSYANNGTYTANTGRFIFMSEQTTNTLSGSLTGNSGKFYNLDFEGVGAVWTASSNIEVANNIMIQDGEFVAPSNLTVSGNFMNYGVFTSGTGTVTLNATDTDNFIAGTLVGENKFNNFTLNGSGGEWSVAGDIEIDGDLTLTAGTFIGGGNVTVHGGTVDGNGVMMFAGNSSMTNVESVVVGGVHACGLTMMKDLYCWGYNSTGQLGNSSIASTTITPVRVMAGEATGDDARGGYLTNVKYVSAGYYNTCAITYSDFTYCWGQAQYGKIGDGQSSTNRTTPVKVLKGDAVVGDHDGTYLTNMKSLSMSYYHTCGVSNAGTAYCWGGSQYGALGDGQSASDRTSPVRVQDGAATGDNTDGTYLVNMKSIHAGQLHSCALSYGGQVYCWGRRDNGNLGDGITSVTTVTSPVQVQDGVATGNDTDGTYLANIDYLEVDSQESCALSNTNKVYCWGYASDGQMGDGQTSVHRNTPIQPLAGQASGNDTDGTYLVNIWKIKVGDVHTCALSNSGNTYCWGTNTFGAIGNASGGSYTTPRKVVKGESVSGDNDGTYLTNIKDISLGQYTVCTLAYSASIYCWGDSSSLGQYTGSSTNNAPVRAYIPASNFVDIEASYYDTCGLMSNTKVYCSGWNPLGQIGDGTLVNRLGAVAVHAGAAVALDTDGIYLSNIKQMGVGTHYACALSYAGNVYCWGYAANSSLGDGQSSTDRTTPVRVQDGEAIGGDTDGTYLTNIKQIAVGTGHACAVANSGMNYCWGTGTSGQLGNGASSTQTTPVRVQDGAATGSDTDGTYLINIRQISSRGSHTCAVSYAGNIYCWGAVSSGQLGDAQTATARNSPVRVHDGVATSPDSDGTYLTNILEVFGGVTHTCAISLIGNVYCWGEGNQGQLGDGQTAVDQTTPVRVQDGVATGSDTDGTYLTNIRSMSGGGVQACAISRSGNTYCWGNGGRIGVGDGATYSSPVKVQDGVATGVDSDGTFLINQLDASAGFAGQFDSAGHSCFISLVGKLYCTGSAQISYEFGQFSDAAGYQASRSTVTTGAKGIEPQIDAMNLYFNGTGTFGGSSEWNLPNVSFGETASGTTTTAGIGAINIFGDVNIASGHTFDAGSKTITINDDFTNLGTFNGNTGTLVFDNSGNIATLLGGGVTNFNNLTIATPGKIVKFEAGEMFTINGTLAITGTETENVVITSTASDAQWLVNHQGTESVSYATISWSGCSSSPSSTYVNVSNGTNTDNLNNGTCWAFVPILELTFGPGGGPTGGGAGSSNNSGVTSGEQNGGGSSTENSGSESNSSSGGGSGGGGGASP